MKNLWLSIFISLAINGAAAAGAYIGVAPFKWLIVFVIPGLAISGLQHQRLGGLGIHSSQWYSSGIAWNIGIYFLLSYLILNLWKILKDKYLK